MELPPYGGPVEPPGRGTSGRHRKPGETPTVVVVRVVAAFIVVGLATVAGVASFQGPTQRPSIAPASVPAHTTVTDPSRNIVAPSDQRAVAYFEALEREGVHMVDIPTLLLAADSVGVRRGDTTVPAQADQLMAAFPGRWEPQQAAVIVDRAIKHVCV